MGSFGKSLVIFGIIIMIIGIIMMVSGKFGLGRLPGDIYFKKGNFTFYFPVVTSIVISIVLSILLKIIIRK